MGSDESTSWRAGKAPGPLTGAPAIPGDKSISHRAVMLAAIADGSSRIEGFLEGADTRATAGIFEAMGVRIEAPAPGVRVVHGVGVDGLRAPSAPLDCGNAGTGMRLLTGLLAGQHFDSTLMGDASLSMRPMRRVIEPLAAMGARIDSDDGHAPLRIRGGQSLRGIDYASPVASAQVKSAVLLAGLYAAGRTVVREPAPTRDYTERMLQAFGYAVDAAPGLASLEGGGRLRAGDVVVPADFSSAAFFLVAATLVPGSELVLRGVGMDPLRTGLLRALELMGADIHTLPDAGGEGGALPCGSGASRDKAPGDGSVAASAAPTRDLVARFAPLQGIEVPEDLVPDMIDEFPILCVAAACARGHTVIRGAAELRVKESDRIAAMATGLRALGITVEEMPDGLVIEGGRLCGGEVDSHGDHRIAMAFAVAGQVADGDVRIRDVANVGTSFPGFLEVARTVGMSLGSRPWVGSTR